MEIKITKRVKLHEVNNDMCHNFYFGVYGAQTCAEEQLVKTAQFSNGEAIYERKTPRTELKAALL